MILDPASLSFLGTVENHLSAALSSPLSEEYSSSQKVLLESARHLVFSDHAKRIRPLLVYFSGRIFKEEDRNWAGLGTAAELIHSASLLHDDVVDEATTRRHSPTANARWGNAVAILAGDWLLTVALRQLQNMDSDVIRSAIDVVARMTEAGIHETLSRGRLDMSVAEWRKMAEGKTASLFEWCARAATWDAADPSVHKRLGDGIRRFAVAFQMVDDLKDVVRTPSGKDAFADILNRELNAAILVAVHRSEALKSEVSELWARPRLTREDVQSVASRIRESGAVGEILQMVDREVGAGLDLLGEFRNTPGGKQIANWAESLARDLSAGGFV